MAVGKNTVDIPEFLDERILRESSPPVWITNRTARVCWALESWLKGEGPVPPAEPYPTENPA